MLVRNTVMPPMRPKIQGNTAMQDEGWLNDVGPLSHPNVQPAIPVQNRREIVTNATGYGPLEVLLRDDSISEITCIGPRRIYVERNGLLEEVTCAFEHEEQMLRVIESLLRQSGQRLQPDWPIMDVRLPDGVQLYAVLPPYSVNGPTLTLRKERKSEPLTLANMVRDDILSQQMADVLEACVEGRLNILVCGTPLSGRTTLLEALSTVIPDEERIITIEELPELRLSQPQVISLIARAKEPCVTREVTVRDLLLSALHMGPERIVLDECQGSEALELLQALFTGHNGLLATIEGKDAQECLNRFETMCQSADSSLPLQLLRRQIAESVDVIVQVARMPDGSHKVTDIAEVLHEEQNNFNVQHIFHYSLQNLVTQSGRLTGTFEACGIHPSFLKKLEVIDIHLSETLFEAKNVDSNDDTVKLSRK